MKKQALLLAIALVFMMGFAAQATTIPYWEVLDVEVVEVIVLTEPEDGNLEIYFNIGVVTTGTTAETHYLRYYPEKKIRDFKTKAAYMRYVKAMRERFEFQVMIKGDGDNGSVHIQPGLKSRRKMVKTRTEGGKLFIIVPRDRLRIISGG